MNSPVVIARIVRPMRGGSQARLVVGQDSHWYVAKFAGNPQGTRTLINEWVACKLLEHLGVCTPVMKILQLPSDFLNKDVCFSIGNRKTEIQGTLHLGSRCPVNPERIVIFDFLPNRLLPKVVNLSDFAAMLVFDQFVAQSDTRQAIFVRDRSVVRAIGFRAYFIDHGMSFNGAAWELREVSPYGAYFRPEVYSYIDLNCLIEKALCRLEAITVATLLTIVDGVPSAWFAPGDRKYLLNLLDKLQRRQARIRSIVSRNLETLIY